MFLLEWELLGAGIVLGSSSLGCRAQGLAGIGARPAGKWQSWGAGASLEWGRGTGFWQSWEGPEAWLPLQPQHGPSPASPSCLLYPHPASGPMPHCAPRSSLPRSRPGLPLTCSSVASPRGLPGLNQLPNGEGCLCTQQFSRGNRYC